MTHTDSYSNLRKLLCNGHGLFISLTSISIACMWQIHHDLQSHSALLSNAIIFLTSGLFGLTLFNNKESPLNNATGSSTWIFHVVCGFVIFVLISNLLTGAQTDWETLLKVALGIALLLAFYCALSKLMTKGNPDNLFGLQLVLMLYFLLLTAPLWLGPIAFYFANNSQVVNSIINLSPLSYLASLMDYDYLRSSWFYQNTPFGGLRYEYLDSLVNSMIYIIFTIAIFYSQKVRILNNIGK